MPGLRTDRTTRERLADDLLTLALLHRCSPDGPVGDRLKVTKLMFLTTHEMFRQRAKGFNFSFYRYSYGPFTPQVYETWEDLSTSGLIEVEQEPWGQIRLTEKGRQVAETFIDEVLEQNPEFERVLRSVADSYSGETTAGVLRRVYARAVRPMGWEEETTVGDAPEGVYFTRVLDELEAKVILEVGDEWLQRFDLIRQGALAASTGIPFLHSVNTLQEVQRALDAEARGEGTRVTLDEVKRKYGIG